MFEFAFLSRRRLSKGRGRAASPSPFLSNTHNSFLDSPLLIPPFSPPPPPPRLFNLLFLPHAEMRRGGGRESAAVRRSCYRHRSITYMPSGGRGEGEGSPQRAILAKGGTLPPLSIFILAGHTKTPSSSSSAAAPSIPLSKQSGRGKRQQHLQSRQKGKTISGGSTSKPQTKISITY